MRALAAALAWLLLAAAPAAAALHALVVGINAYTTPGLAPLRGAVNDAHAIAAALRALGADVRTLTDAAATRARFLAEWTAMLGRARAGDTVVLTFSGHGMQAPERVPGSETDGRDEYLVFVDFRRQGAGTAERLLDDEIAELFAEAGRRGLRVVFVADACHSGTMTRTLDPRLDAPAIRTLGLVPLVNDQFRPIALPAGPTEMEQPHVTYLAAARDGELVTELRIDGSHHGAMSWSFARALAGGADADGDGRITRGELSRFVLRSIRSFSEANQHPEVRPEDRPDEVLFELPGRVRAEAARAPAPRAPDTVRLQVQGAAPAVAAALVGRLAGAAPAAGADAADLVYDAAAREVLNAMPGDVVAHDIAPEALQPVVDKYRALAALRHMGLRGGLDFAVLPSDARHRGGALVTVTLSGLRHPHLVLVNLSGDGKVELLYPRPSDPLAVDPARPRELRFRVQAPFGAEHLVALATAAPATATIAALRALDGTRDPLAALRALAAADGQVGVQAVFTRP